MSVRLRRAVRMGRRMLVMTTVSTVSRRGASILAVASIFIGSPVLAQRVLFDGARVVLRPTEVNEPMGLVTGDFDENGRPDLVVTDYEKGFLTTLFGDGEGGF